MTSSGRVPRRRSQAGFSLMELAIAILILIVGITAVAQLIPAAMESNFRNRYDSSGMIYAQRQLELMASQDIQAGNPVANAHYTLVTTLPDGVATTIRLGLNAPAGGCTPPSANPAIAVMCSDAGAQITIEPSSGNLVINWTQAAGAVTTNYRNQFSSPEGYLYETRWRVMTIFTTLSGVTRPVAKRIILSTRGGPPGVAAPPPTLMTWTVWR
ncbi:MAG: type IV pilus modification PilV family protein [Candidatus Acidiferrales bacterium]